MQHYHEKLHQLVSEKFHNDHSKSTVSITNWNWNGHFENGSKEKKLLKKLERKANLTKLEISLTKWEVFVEIQQKFEHILNAEVLCNLFDKMIFRLQSRGTLSNSDEVQPLSSKFWSATEMLITNLTSHLVKNRLKVLTGLSCDQSILNCVKVWSHIKTYSDRNSLYSSLRTCVRKNFEELVCQYLTGADEWFNLESSKISSEIASVESLIQLGTELVNELSPRVPYLTQVFERIQINLANAVFTIWDEQFAEILKPIVEYACSTLKQIDPEIIIPVNNSDYIMEENLFKLFLVLRDFVQIGKQHLHVVSVSGSGSFHKKNSISVANSYHNLFMPCVLQWLNLTFLKNLARIQIAVELDNLQVVAELAQISCSAIDVSELLMKTNDFWTQLAWPVPKESYSFVVVLVKNLDRCIRHYTDTIWNRVCELHRSQFENFEISDELYIALNNIDEVQKHAESIIHKLQVPKLVETLQKNTQNHHSCTLPALIENMKKTVCQKIADIIAWTWQNNMEHMFLALLDHCAETKSATDFSTEKYKLVSHFVRIFSRMRTKLARKDYISTLRCIIWKHLLNSVETYLDTCKNLEKPHLVFQHLQIVLFDLEKVLGISIPGNCNLVEADHVLKLKTFMRLHGSSSLELQMEYLTIRFREQCNIKDFTKSNSIGRLAIVAEYDSEAQKLHLEILHAVLHNDISESYVKLQVIIRDDQQEIFLYTDIKKSKCPIFEKKFFLDIPKSNWTHGGIIRFWVKNRGILRTKPFVYGEAVLPLENILVTEEVLNENPKPGSVNEIIKLPLTSSSESKLKCDILDILQNRKADKQAWKFVQRERRRFI